MNTTRSENTMIRHREERRFSGLRKSSAYSAVKSRYLDDCRAVSYPLEYVIISGIAILFFAVVMLTAGAMLTAAPLD
ncbi:MAG: hypothetical protein U9O53_00005, partial [archaeon]|nr:hypothetical protein [archaeon]